MEHSYRGTCFCGAVEIAVTGQPNAMGYCHCRSCRSWSGGPVNAFSLWPPEAVTVTKVNSTSHLSQDGTEPPAVLSSVRRPSDGASSAVEHGRRFCRDHTEPRVRAAGARQLRRDRMPMRDGLPKLKDFPKEFGGSGEVVSE